MGEKKGLLASKHPSNVIISVNKKFEVTKSIQNA